MRKRVMSILLVLALCLGLLPAPAWAAEETAADAAAPAATVTLEGPTTGCATIQEAFNAVAAGQIATIELLKSAEVSEPLTVAEGATIFLTMADGVELTGTGNVTVFVYGNLILQNGTIINTHDDQFKDSACIYVSPESRDGSASLTIEDGTLESTYYCVYAHDSNMQIEGGHFTGTPCLYSWGAVVSLTGGTFEGGFTVESGSVGELLGENCGLIDTSTGDPIMADQLNGSTLTGSFRVEQTYFPPLTVTVTPESQTVGYPLPAGGVTLTAEVKVNDANIDANTITYQWQLGDDSWFENIEGATNKALTIPASDLTELRTHSYRCTVGSSSLPEEGSVWSNTATITVVCRHNNVSPNGWDSWICGDCNEGMYVSVSKGGETRYFREQEINDAFNFVQTGEAAEIHVLKTQSQSVPSEALTVNGNVTLSMEDGAALTSNAYTAIQIGSGGSLTMKNGIVEANYDSKNTSAIYCHAGGSLTIEGGTVLCPSGTCVRVGEEGGPVRISGGSFSGDKGLSIGLSGADVKLSGGLFTGSTYAIERFTFGTAPVSDLLADKCKFQKADGTDLTETETAEATLSGSVRVVSAVDLVEFTTQPQGLTMYYGERPKEEPDGAVQEMPALTAVAQLTADADPGTPISYSWFMERNDSAGFQKVDLWGHGPEDEATEGTTLPLWELRVNDSIVELGVGTYQFYCEATAATSTVKSEIVTVTVQPSGAQLHVEHYQYHLQEGDGGKYVSNRDIEFDVYAMPTGAAQAAASLLAEGTELETALTVQKDGQTIAGLTVEKRGNYFFHVTISKGTLAVGTHTLTLQFTGDASLADATGTTTFQVVECGHPGFTDGKCDVCGAAVVAEIAAGGSVKYYTDFQDAWDDAAAMSGEVTIRVHRGKNGVIKPSGSLTVPGGKTIRLELKNPGSYEVTLRTQITVEEGGTLILKGCTIFSQDENTPAVTVNGALRTENAGIQPDMYGNLGQQNSLYCDDWTGGSNKPSLTVGPKGTADLSYCQLVGILTAEGQTIADVQAGTPGYALQILDPETFEFRWLTADELAGSTLTGTMKMVPIPVEIADLTKTAEATYGAASEALTVTAETDTGKDITYQWYDEGGTAVSGQTGATLTVPADLGVGDHKFYCAVTCDGYTLNSDTATVTVKPRELTARFTGTLTKTYDGTAKFAAAPIDGDLSLEGVLSGDTVTCGQYTFGEISAPDAGTRDITITITELEGDDAKNYVLPDPDIEATIEISPKPLDASAITLAKDSYEYTGSAIAPAVTVRDEALGYTLKASEYSVAYTNNIAHGTATVTITDNEGGNYTVSGVKSFEITQPSLEGADVTLDGNSFTYDGKAHEPAVTVVKDGKTLAEGTDYTVAYTGNVDAGTATVTVTATEDGNYFGAKEVTFTIERAPLGPVLSGTSTKAFDDTTNALTVWP